MKVRCIMLRLENPEYVRMLKDAIFNHMDIVDRDYCLNEGYNLLCDVEPHVTLFYGFTNLAENMCYNYLKIKNRDAYKKLRELSKTQHLNMPEVVIDTFDNPDRKVLKINLEKTNLFEPLNEYYQFFRTLSNDSDFNGPDYHPHITLTYLKPDTTQEQINELLSEIDMDKLKVFTLKDFKLSGGDSPGEDNNYSIIPL